MKLEHIVIASDLSAACRATHPHAAAWVQATGARVTLLNVDELSGRSQSGLVGAVGGYLDALRGARGRRIEETLADLERRGLEADLEVVPGQPRAAIDRWVRVHGVDLVIMTKRSRSALEGVLLGSTVSRYLRLASVPVLVVPDTPSGEDALQASYHHVLTGTDCGDAARPGLAAAAAVAQALGAGLTAAHVVEEPAWGQALAVEVLGARPDGDAGASLDAIRERLQAVLRDARYDDAVATVVRAADAAEGLVEVTRAAAVDLIAVPSTGKGPLERVLLGSTTERLVKTAPVPVLVFPREWLDSPKRWTR